MFKNCETQGCGNWAQWRVTYYDKNGKEKFSLKLCHQHYVERKDDKNVKCIFAGAMPERAA
jgi:hypothetical protein